MGTPDFCLCENKGADQLCCKLAEFLFFFNPKFQASSLLLSIQVGLCQNWSEIFHSCHETNKSHTKKLQTNPKKLNSIFRISHATSICCTTIQHRKTERMQCYSREILSRSQVPRTLRKYHFSQHAQALEAHVAKDYVRI